MNLLHHSRAAALSLLALLPLALSAQTPCPPGKLCNPTDYATLDALLMGLVDVVVQYGALLVVLFLVLAGFKFVTAQGNTEKISDARKMLVWVIVGAFVLLGVYVIKAAICGTVQSVGVEKACDGDTTEGNSIGLG